MKETASKGQSLFKLDNGKASTTLARKIILSKELRNRQGSSGIPIRVNERRISKLLLSGLKVKIRASRDRSRDACISLSPRAAARDKQI